VTFDEDYEPAPEEPGQIGVGMGGSCPVCRAPVDLGQEFCLECGSPIRFTPRQRRAQRGRAAGGAAGAAPPAAPAKSGFPWVPFLVVLALIGGGLAFAFVDGGDSENSSGKDKTEPALPEITNSTPTETGSSTQTTTVADCATAGLDGTQPAIDGSTGDTSPTEDIPSLGDGSGATDGSAFGDPSIPSTDGTSGATVTVDQQGNLCPASGSGTPTVPSTDPTATTPTTPTTATTSTGATASGDWPAGEEGWTVVVAYYPSESRATQAAADLQEDGFSDGGVLFSTDFPNLCPDLYVVFSGVFDGESQAESRKEDLSRKDYAGMYVREIKNSGDRPSSCQTARPQN
jgi:hypothetical protein